MSLQDAIDNASFLLENAAENIIGLCKRKNQ